jgi:hypothetical protein
VKFRVIGTLKVILINGKKLSIGIDFGIGIDQNSWYRTGIVSKPKKLVSPITTKRVGKGTGGQFVDADQK